VRKVTGKMSGRPMVSGAMYNALKRESRDVRRGAKPRTRIITAPVASGGVYTGGSVALNPSVRGRLNCAHLRTRQFLGQILVKATTGALFWSPKDGTVDCGGQYYFMPSNNFYWPTGCPIITSARMYQFFFLNSCSFEFESSYQPGNTNPLKTYVAFANDPNAYITQVGTGHTSTENVSSSFILSFTQNSCSFPTWKPKMVCAPPPKFYRGRSFEVRSYAFNQAFDFTQSAENKQATPFVMYVRINGSTPLADLVAYDVFVNLDMDFCELMPSQQFDNQGAATFDSKSDVKSLSTQLEELTRRMNTLTGESEEDMQPVYITKPVMRVVEDDEKSTSSVRSKEKTRK